MCIDIKEFYKYQKMCCCQVEYIIVSKRVAVLETCSWECVFHGNQLGLWYI